MFSSFLGRDQLDEIYACNDSHPPSGESSARQTPQPQYIPNKEVQNTFNKQVNMVINQDKMDEVEQSSPPSHDQHIDTQSLYQTLPPTPQAVHISNRIELVQSSKLQVKFDTFKINAYSIIFFVLRCLRKNSFRLQRIQMLPKR